MKEERWLADGREGRKERSSYNGDGGRAWGGFLGNGHFSFRSMQELKAPSPLPEGIENKKVKINFAKKVFQVLPVWLVSMKGAA
jgi:hypothetical protein